MLFGDVHNHPGLIFSGKAGAYPSGDSYDKAMNLKLLDLAGIDWQWMKNTVACYDMELITFVKCLIARTVSFRAEKENKNLRMCFSKKQTFYGKSHSW